jgi:hypothetical protein
MTIRTRIVVDGPLLFDRTFGTVESATVRIESHHVELGDGAESGPGYCHRFYYWLTDGPAAEFEAAHGRDDDVADVRRIASDGDRFYRTRTPRLPRDRRPVVQRVAEHDLGILTCRRSVEGVTMSLLGASRRDLDGLFRELRDAGFDVKIERLMVGDAGSSRSMLTPVQRETLRLAYERGYYEIPRGTSLMELASDLGVSDQACSERLRRGIQRILDEEFD